MASQKPWSVKGIGPETRELAKAIAHGEGLTLGAWLSQKIAESADPPAPSEGPERDVDALHRSLDQLSDTVARLKAQDQSSLDALDGAISRLTARLDAASTVVAPPAPTPIPTPEPEPEPAAIEAPAPEIDRPQAVADAPAPAPAQSAQTEPDPERGLDRGLWSSTAPSWGAEAWETEPENAAPEPEPEPVAPEPVPEVEIWRGVGASALALDLDADDEPATGRDAPATPAARATAEPRDEIYWAPPAETETAAQRSENWRRAWVAPELDATDARPAVDDIAPPPQAASALPLSPEQITAPSPEPETETETETSAEPPAERRALSDSADTALARLAERLSARSLKSAETARAPAPTPPAQEPAEEPAEERAALQDDMAPDAWTAPTPGASTADLETALPVATGFDDDAETASTADAALTPGALKRHLHRLEARRRRMAAAASLDAEQPTEALEVAAEPAGPSTRNRALIDAIAASSPRFGHDGRTMAAPDATRPPSPFSGAPRSRPTRTESLNDAIRAALEESRLARRRTERGRMMAAARATLSSRAAIGDAPLAAAIAAAQSAPDDADEAGASDKTAPADWSPTPHPAAEMIEQPAAFDASVAQETARAAPPTPEAPTPEAPTSDVWAARNAGWDMPISETPAADEAEIDAPGWAVAPEAGSTDVAAPVHERATVAEETETLPHEPAAFAEGATDAPDPAPDSGGSDPWLPAGWEPDAWRPEAEALSDFGPIESPEPAGFDREETTASAEARLDDGSEIPGFDAPSQPAARIAAPADAFDGPPGFDPVEHAPSLTPQPPDFGVAPHDPRDPEEESELDRVFNTPAFEPAPDPEPEPEPELTENAASELDAQLARAIDMLDFRARKGGGEPAPSETAPVDAPSFEEPSDAFDHASELEAIADPDADAALETALDEDPTIFLAEHGDTEDPTKGLAYASPRSLRDFAFGPQQRTETEAAADTEDPSKTRKRSGLRGGVFRWSKSSSISVEEVETSTETDAEPARAAERRTFWSAGSKSSNTTVEDVEMSTETDVEPARAAEQRTFWSAGRRTTPPAPEMSASDERLSWREGVFSERAPRPEPDAAQPSPSPAPERASDPRAPLELTPAAEIAEADPFDQAEQDASNRTPSMTVTLSFLAGAAFALGASLALVYRDLL